jgi:hypothetical protein
VLEAYESKCPPMPYQPVLATFASNPDPLISS